MPVSTVEVYEKLKPHLGEEGAKALLLYIEEAAQGTVATREDLLKMREDMFKHFEKTREQLASIHRELESIRRDLLSSKPQ
jgi:hypothetical protein